MKGNPVLGAGYLLRGFGLLSRPGIRLFVLIPLSINLLLFAVLITLAVRQFDEWISGMIAWLPGFLDFVAWILWPLAVLLLLVVVTYTFSMLANLIGAPFNGLLAEKVEEMLAGKEVTARENLWQAVKDAPRAMGKELRKIGYYLLWAALVLLLSLMLTWIPIVPPLLWFALGAWMLAMEYCDYPMDNHKHSLAQVRQALRNRRLSSLGFGAATMAGTMIPVVNFLIMPAAVCGATLYWVEELKYSAAPLVHQPAGPKPEPR